MTQKLLLSGERETFTLVEFNPASGGLTVLADYPAPFNSSWVEPQSSTSKTTRLVGLSEGEDAGLVFTFEIDHANNVFQISSQQPTLGAPAHISLLRDGSGVVVGTYLGGSVAIYPSTVTEMGGIILTTGNRAEIKPGFPYASQGHGKDPIRQRQSHVHQVVEDKRGLLYAADLGSDRVWILRRNASRVETCGWLQCPAGTGPRHAVLSPDERILYVIGELSHTVLAFNLAESPSENILAIDGFLPNVITPEIPGHHQSLMDAAEISLHPTIPGVIYVSNRWARHIAEREPHLTDVPKDLPSGDNVAIVLLSPDGRSVQAITHVQTRLDVIRGMRLSDDGQYAAVVGQEGGGLEIYEISGARGDVWRCVANLHDGIEGGIKHVVWL